MATNFITHKVVKGETLMSIAKKYKDKYYKGYSDTKARNTIAAYNEIPSPYRIHVGQKILIATTVSGSTVKKSKNNSLTPKIKAFGIQSDSENTVFATWKFDKDHTKEYKCIWYYSTGDGVLFVGSETTETHKQSTYSPPSNALSVSFKVKAIAKTHKVTSTKTEKKKVKGKTKTTKKKVTKDVAYWTGKWSKTVTCNFKTSQEPEQPSAPTVELDKYKLTAKVENLADGVNIATNIEFRVVKNNGAKAYKCNTATVTNRSASYTWNVDASGKYKVQCRAIRQVSNHKLYSDWSDFSSETTTIPAAPKQITSIKANSSTEIMVTWSSVANADSYEVQYTTKQTYFDKASEGVSSVTIESGCTAIITGLDSGGEYFFRVRAVNDQGKSGWCPIKSCTVGKKPAAPTTWSTTTTAIVGETVNLYWVHNSQDNSMASKAQLELIVDGEDHSPSVFTYTHSDDEEEKTYSYELDTNDYAEGGKIQWRVRTAGVTGEFGDWSIQRTIDIYAPPTLELHLVDVDDNDIDMISSFPLYVKGITGPESQTPIGFHLSVISTDNYTSEDSTGTEYNVGLGEEIYSKYFDIKTQLIAELTASNIDLENGVTYTVKCIVTMDSGLTAEATADFMVDWEETEYGVDAEIIYNEDSYSCSIRPYCYATPDEYYEITDDGDIEDEETSGEDDDDPGQEITLVEGVSLAVYRREYNGEFVEIASDLTNDNHTFVTDPHPALDYARYRVVATQRSTGAISYADIPEYPIEETPIIIQWNETWGNLVTSDENQEEIPDEATWMGSRVILPYNIDVSDKNDIDVALVEYIGRKRPVSYYGTQLGETASWKVDIPKDDDETLYALRKLAIYTGDVYVREPSGSGYWASISVSFSQTHREMVIPVSIELTRVEGGM